MYVVKECIKCKQVKVLEDFYKHKLCSFGYSSRCKPCTKVDNEISRRKNIENVKISYRNYYVSNREKILLYHKEYNVKNKEAKKEYDKEYNRYRSQSCKDKKKEYNKEYRERNKDKVREYKRNYEFNRKRVDKLYRFEKAVRNAIYDGMRRGGYQKKHKANEILGCDFKTFKLHIAKQFKKGMTWDNYGEWHLDHIYPVSLAKDEKHLLKLNHYTNFQPLWAEDNIRKGNKLVEKQQFVN